MHDLKNLYLITGNFFAATIEEGYWCRGMKTAEPGVVFKNFRFQMILIWMTINLVPQFSFALFNLIAVIGTRFKDIRRVLFKYPQLILCPTFSTYTFGAIHTNHWCYM